MTEFLLKSETKRLRGYRFEYCLFEDNTSVDGITYPCYSVYASVSGKGYFDEATVRDVSADRSTAERVFGEIVRGRAAPCTLADVIEDMI